jgi:hypothetical protein
MTKNRAASDQPISIHQLGAYHTCSDTPGSPQDLEQAVELRLRAGELGNATSSVLPLLMQKDLEWKSQWKNRTGHIKRQGRK